MSIRWKVSTLVLVASMAGCAQTNGGSSSTSTTAAPAAAAAKGIPPGMDAAGNVTDASKVEGGYGTKVKGINDTDGEITGKLAPGSKFGLLKVGMGMKQVTDLVGQPTDQGTYITGKAFIPFYFGSDRYRYELVYKGWGRLIFAGGSMGNLGGGNLFWVINSASEPGYR